LPSALPVCLLLVCLLFCAACSTPGPLPDPSDVALKRSRSAVFSGVREAFEESEEVDEFVVQARRNPCRCDAPPNEIYVHGRWTRVYFEADDALLSEFDATMTRAENNGVLRTVALRGAFSGDTRTSERGIEYPVFELLELNL
jgi:hypothetical protein